MTLYRLIAIPLPSDDDVRFKGYAHFARLPALNAYIYGDPTAPNPATYKDTEHFSRSFSAIFEVVLTLLNDARNGKTEPTNSEDRISHFRQTLENLIQLYKRASATLGFKLKAPHKAAAFHKAHPDDKALFTECFDTKSEAPPIPQEGIVEFMPKLPQHAYFVSGHQVIELISTLLNPLLVQQTNLFDQQEFTPEQEAHQELSCAIMEELSNQMIFLSHLDPGEYVKYRQHLRGTSGGASVALRHAYSICLRSMKKIREVETDTGLTMTSKGQLLQEKEYTAALKQHFAKDETSSKAKFMENWIIQVETMMRAFYTHHSLAVMALGSKTNGTMALTVANLTAKHHLSTHPRSKRASQAEAPAPATAASIEREPPADDDSPLTTKALEKKLQQSLSEAHTIRQTLLPDTPPDGETRRFLNKAQQLLIQASQTLKNCLLNIQKAHDLKPEETKRFLEEVIRRDHPEAPTILHSLSHINRIEMMVLDLQFRTTMIGLATQQAVSNPTVDRTLTEMDEIMSELAAIEATKLGTAPYICEQPGLPGCLITEHWDWHSELSP